MFKTRSLKCCIAGSRDFHNYEKMEVFCDNILYSEKYKDCRIEIVTGGAKGADQLGHIYAIERRMGEKVFMADWDKYGKPAGMIRNREMAEYTSQADVSILIAFWDGKSKGTKNMIEQADKFGLECFVCEF